MITQSEIIEKYKYMFKLMDQLKCRYPISWGMECGNGWNQIIDECLAELNELDTTNELFIFQIKEKFGVLRIYIETEVEDLGSKAYDIIWKHEARTNNICEQCGAPGTMRSGGWLKCLCDTCQTARGK